MHLSNRLNRSLNRVRDILMRANRKNYDFKKASKMAKVSVPSVMLYAKLLGIKWENYKPRGKYGQRYGANSKKLPLSDE